MRILVLSDIHYPFSDEREILRIISKEKPSKIILNGDIIAKAGLLRRFFRLIPKRLRRNTYFINGDEDRVKGDYDVLRLRMGDARLVFIHGHQFNIKSDNVTANIARLFKIFGSSVPLFLFAFYARRRLHLHGEYLFLGHSHGLKNFKSIRTVCCGTISNLRGVYNDRGYVVIDNGKVRIVKLRKLY